MLYEVPKQGLSSRCNYLSYRLIMCFNKEISAKMNSSSTLFDVRPANSCNPNGRGRTLKRNLQLAFLMASLLLLNASSITAQSTLDEQVPYQGDTLLINPNQVREIADGDILMDCDWPTMMSMIRDLEERIAGETETDTVYGVYVSGAMVGSSLNMWHDCLVLRDSIEALQVTYDEALAPRVTVDSAVILSDISAALSASFSGSGVEASGFEWSSNEDMTDSSHGPDSDTGENSPIKDTLTTLDAGKTHYFTAYANKDNEKFYGDTLSLLTMPGITTVAADDITLETATLNATFSADSITSQGFVWGLQADLSDGASVSADTTDGSTAIETELTGLTAGTVHYFSAFATNASGTSYGDTLSFSTPTPITSSNIQDAVDLWVSDEASATTLYGHISDWNTSAVTTMKDLFKDKTTFDDDISNWDVSNVTDMRYMFYEAADFNQYIGGWDVSNVTEMSNMFRSAADFNQYIGGWDVSAVTNMSYMFTAATSFNRDISEWNVSNVTLMLGMFQSASAFNQDIGGWNVSNVTNMYSMFASASAFNGDISEWNVSNVTNMSYMFKSISSQAGAFNQDIGDWNVSNVTDMSYMFQSTTAFNQDLSGWCVTNIDPEPASFGNLGTDPVWGTCPAVD